MTCKGICVRYKADSNHYANGLNRPRNFKLKPNLREQEVIEEAKKIDNNMTRWLIHF